MPRDRIGTSSRPVRFQNEPVSHRRPAAADFPNPASTPFPAVQPPLVTRFGRRALLPIAALVLAASTIEAGAAAEPPVVVAVSSFPPHVMETNGNLTGFDIEVWEEVADAIGVESEFRIMPFEALLRAVEEAEVGAALAGISVTHNRELNMDFSIPYINTGLRILTRVNPDPPLIRLIRSVSTLEVLGPLLYLLAFIILCAHVLYLAERGSTAISQHYFPGVFEAAWCILATITTVGYGDIAPVRWIGRFVSFLVMALGISLFGVAIAELSSGLMMEELRGDISGVEDLHGHPVATVAGTTSARVARRFESRVLEVDEVEAAYGLLTSGEVDAVLFDAAPLMRHAQQDGNRTVTVVGPLIERQAYAVAFPQGSPLRESVNRALLMLRENGVYHEIYRRWFGNAE